MKQSSRFEFILDGRRMIWNEAAIARMRSISPPSGRRKSTANFRQCRRPIFLRGIRRQSKPQPGCKQQDGEK
jgi:hypothetical protein